jgi:DNA-binding NarL/FixJ family response regulator
MLAAPTPIFLGMDSRGRRLRLASLVELHPGLRLLGHAPVDHSCLRAAVARRPEVLVVAPAHGRHTQGGHLMAAVRRGCPDTTILSLADPDERPASQIGGEVSADRFLPAATPGDRVLQAVLDLVRARHEARDRRVAEGRRWDGRRG